MALLWFDGFESYQGYADFEATRNPVISSIDASSYSIITTTAARVRTGTRALYLDGYVWYTKWNLASNYTTFFFGIAMRKDDNVSPSYHASYPTLAFYDGATIQLRFDIVGTEIAVRNGDGTLLGTTVGAGLDYTLWRYIEIKITIDNAAGAIEVKSGEVTVLNLSSQDTQNTANAYFNAIRLQGPYNNVSFSFDDMYWCDATGSKNNDFLGDVRVDALLPNGAGMYSEFTPSAGDNYQNVDETYPDDDTTYNSGSNVGDQDTYALSDLEVLGTTIHGVKSQITVRKTDAGARGVKILTIAGLTGDLSDEISLSDTYTTQTKIFEDNPDDSAAWEEADVNAMEVGVEITT